jgi:lysophospholipase L1-like esterase
MKKIILLIAVLGLALCLTACNRKGGSDDDTPDEYIVQRTTAAAGAAWADDGLDGRSFVFLHHSCGSGFLREGGMWAKLEDLGLSVYEIGYGDGWIGDNTNPDQVPTTFGEHMGEVLRRDLAGADQHDIVAFKSCFPASNVTSDEMLKQYQGYYQALKPYFAKQPQVLFVAWTAPPLVPGATAPENAARHRRFCDWLKSEWVKGQKNVAVFDCNAVLADKGGMLKREYRRDESDSHPNAAGNKAVAAAFAEWLPAAVQRWDG